MPTPCRCSRDFVRPSPAALALLYPDSSLMLLNCQSFSDVRGVTYCTVLSSAHDRVNMCDHLHSPECVNRLSLVLPELDLGAAKLSKQQGRVNWLPVFFVFIGASDWLMICKCKQKQERKSLERRVHWRETSLCRTSCMRSLSQTSLFCFYCFRIAFWLQTTRLCS